MFLVFNSRTESFGNSSIFAFLLTAIHFYTDFCIYFSEIFAMGLVMF
jgi:hypothetical protein